MITHTVGAILAGGSSSRMGRDKSRLVIEGTPFLDRVHETMSEVFTEVIVCGGTEVPMDGVLIPDEIPGEGPLGGILSAFRISRGRPVFVTAVDMPVVTPEAIRTMADPVVSGAWPGSLVWQARSAAVWRLRARSRRCGPPNTCHGEAVGVCCGRPDRGCHKDRCRYVYPVQREHDGRLRGTDREAWTVKIRLADDEIRIRLAHADVETLVDGGCRRLRCYAWYLFGTSDHICPREFRGEVRVERHRCDDSSFCAADLSGDFEPHRWGGDAGHPEVIVDLDKQRRPRKRGD